MKKSSLSRLQSRSGELRIIAGKWRRRKLPFAHIDGLRPTPNRVRETVFNWLQPKIQFSCCLDLFAGSGAMGFEAASRGAKQVVLVEKNDIAVGQLLQNKQKLMADTVQIIHDDAFNLVKKLDSLFDIIFIDPPFQAVDFFDICYLIDQQGCLKEDAVIYIERPKGSDLKNLPENWIIHRKKSAGQVDYYLVNLLV